jgi:hypothetical protein
MSTKLETSITVLPAPAVTAELQLVRPGTPLAHALDAQGVDIASPAAQRAVAKAVTSLAKDLMEGAALLAADSGNDGAKRAVACLQRVRRERASK